MDGSTWIARGDHAAARMFDDGQGGVVLHVGSGAYHGINRIGAVIWDSLPEEGAALGDVVARVRAQLDDAPADLEDDVIEFFEQLAERDLVRTHDPR
jgi:hypothetical protein